MIQRKQTLWLLAAIVCFIITAMMPLGYIVPEVMGPSSTINGIGVIDGSTNELSFPFGALPIIILALNIAQSLLTIFSYKNRKSQATQCTVQIVSIVVEYIACGVVIWLSCIKDTACTYGISWAIFLPIAAMVFIILAHKGIMDDERLIRSIDRIR